VVELDPKNRAGIEKFFIRYPYLHGSAMALAVGGMGRVFVDDANFPQVALGYLDFYFLAGEASHPHAKDLVKYIDDSGVILTPDEAWRELLLQVFFDRLQPYVREVFNYGQFDVNQLEQNLSRLPVGFKLKRIALPDVEKLGEDLHPALYYNFDSEEDFIRNGFGFAVVHEEQFVSGASSAAVGDKYVEIEIQTHPDFQRQGLARITASALILHCLKNNLVPCWDAANDASANLARQLGFVSAGKYSAWFLR